ncbi:MAG TPA: sulfatase [Myxococcota bacterium]|nr:sulfatase [Myxococcota bacterium]
MRKVLGLALGLALLAGCSHAPRFHPPPALRPSSDHPNVVLIVAEDLSPHLGSYGDPVAHTPRLDQLAREGIRFANAFTTAPVCAPSRATIITGVYPRSAGTMHMRTSRAFDAPDGARSFSYQAVPPPEVKAFPELLRRAGYFTANHLKTDYQFGEPFTIWNVNDPDETHRTLWRDAPKGVPFLAMINPWITHESFLWPTEPANGEPAVVGIAARNKKAFEGYPPTVDPAAVRLSPYLPDTPGTRRDVARQYDNASILDAQVGEILDALRADGLLDKTIVIFTTDHGDGLPNAKRRAYDSGLHVPLIVRLPDGTDAGTVRTDVVSFVDMAPTILDLAGLEIPSFMQGQPFLGPHARRREYVYAAVDRLDRVFGKWRSVRDTRFQYLANRMTDQPLFEHVRFRDVLPSMQDLWRLHEAHQLTPLQESQFETPRPAEELYDVQADPDEAHDLARDPAYADVLARMRAALADFEARTPDLSPRGEREMAERMWPGLVQPRTEPPEAVPAPGGIELASPTPGASVGYRFPHDPPGFWRLYVEPIALPRGATLEAKAIRYGYAESPVVALP